MTFKAQALFMKAWSVNDREDLQGALRAWGAACDAAEAEIASPGVFTDVAVLASMAATGRFRRGNYFDFQGDAEAAADERASARALIAEHGDSSAQFEIRRSNANTLKWQGRFGEALAELTILGELIDESADPTFAVRVALDRAMLLEWMGDFDRAERELAAIESALPTEDDRVEGDDGFLSQMLAVVQNLEAQTKLQGLRRDLAETRGLHAKRAGRLDEARQIFEALRPANSWVGSAVASDYHLMDIDVRSGDYETAMSRFADLDAAMRSDALLRTKLPALHRLAADAMLDEEPAWSLAQVDAGVPTSESVGDFEVLWRLHRTAAKALIRLGRPEDATDRFLASARTVDELHRVPLGYRLESTYFANKRPMFDEAIVHAATHTHARAALELIELAKSRSLATIVYGAELSSPVDDPLTTRADELSRLIDAWDFRRYDGKPVELADRVALIDERAEVIEQLRARDPRWRALTEPAPFSAETVIEALDGAIAVTLFVQERTLIAVTLSADGVFVDNRVLTTAVWREIGDYCKNVRRAEDPWAYDLSGYGDVMLEDVLPQATVARLLLHDRAVIVPHQQLHLLPWASMQLADDRRLFERVGVAVMPNLMCLAPIEGSWPGELTLSIVGAPDYSALAGLDQIDPDGREFRMLQKVWNQTGPGAVVNADYGVDSTEAAIRQELAGAHDLVHVSCHGIVDHHEPSASALIATDGKVDASEIARSGSCPAEVILAACSVGSRPSKIDTTALVGDDVVGLPAAFLEAGARSIVMSIPEAHDATSVEFMTRLHLARASGMSPIKAFQATQIAMLDVEDPALWCGYVLYGSPSNKVEV